MRSAFVKRPSKLSEHELLGCKECTKKKPVGAEPQIFVFINDITLVLVSVFIDLVKNKLKKRCLATRLFCVAWQLLPGGQRPLSFAEASAVNKPLQRIEV